MGHVFARQGEKAAEMFGMALQELSGWPPPFRFMASCLAHLGRLKEEQEMVRRLQAITPVVIPSAEHWRIREDRGDFTPQLAAVSTHDRNFAQQEEASARNGKRLAEEIRERAIPK